MSILKLFKETRLNHTTQNMYLNHAAISCFHFFFLLNRQQVATWRKKTSRIFSPSAGMWTVAPGPHVLKAAGGAGGGPISPTLCFFGGGWKNYFQGTSTRFLITLTPHHLFSAPPRAPNSPTKPAGWMCLCRESEYGGWGSKESSIMLPSSAVRLLKFTSIEKNAFLCVFKNCGRKVLNERNKRNIFFMPVDLFYK